MFWKHGLFFRKECLEKLDQSIINWVGYQIRIEYIKLQKRNSYKCQSQKDHSLQGSKKVDLDGDTRAI